MSKTRRSRSAKKGGGAELGGSGGASLPPGAASATGVEAPTADDYREARQRAERLEAVGDEVVRRLDAAIASITAMLRRR